MNREYLILSLFNLVALSTLWTITTNWTYNESIVGTTYNKRYDDAPNEAYLFPESNKDEDDGDKVEDDIASHSTTLSREYEWEMPFLQWKATPVKVPPDWTYETPKYCKNVTELISPPSSPTRKIIVHFHLQHNAGTNFYSLAQRFVPCATRACWQTSRHCLISSNEEIEAENIRLNARNEGVEYVSYELMLPPRFPLPFVSDSAREGLFFTTIIRNPLNRLHTSLRRGQAPISEKNGQSPFWQDLSVSKGLLNIYAKDNLNVRWLSGARREITRDHINIAKCRLQLFDLVIADKFYDVATKRVVCPLNNWIGKGYCNLQLAKKPRPVKTDPFNNTDPVFIGSWIERLRPSFEIYDYALLLSLQQLEMRGLSSELPSVSSMPSYFEALTRYVPDLIVTPKHYTKMLPLTTEYKSKYDPPTEFCDQMKNIWRNNPDEVPNVYGIGTLKDGFIED